MSDTVKVRVFISTNKVGSKCEEVLEFDREEWESMTEPRRKTFAATPHSTIWIGDGVKHEHQYQI
jgi:hypothetical protein